MDNIQNGLLFKEEVYQIVGSAMEVAKELGCGFLEAVYQEALEMEFAAQRIPYEAQKTNPHFIQREDIEQGVYRGFRVQR